MPRQPNGRPSIYQGSDGWWYCWVPTGAVYANGKPKRKKIRHKTRTEVADAVKEFELVLKGGRPGAGIETVSGLVDYYLDNVIRRGTRPRSHNTWRSYEGLARLYLKPHLGGYRLRGSKHRLEPEHVSEMFSKLPASLSQSRRRHIYVLLNGALKSAVRMGKADRNVCEMIDAPTVPKGGPKSDGVADAIAYLKAAVGEEEGVRYVIGVLLGPRQGEVLGLRWHRLDLDPPTPEDPYLLIQRQVQRRTYEHGCKDPAACVAKMDRCRTKPCPPRYEHGCGKPCGKKLTHFCPARRLGKGCSTHKTKTGGAKPCPPLCPKGCDGHARHCPNPVGGIVEQDLKQHRTDEKVPLGATLTELLREHRVWQQRRYADMHLDWDAEGYVFQSHVILGHARDPRYDYQVHQSIRAKAGLPPGRLHVGRHTAGSMMTAVGTDIRVVQAILGHAQITTTQHYVDVAMTVKRQAIDKVAEMLFEGKLAGLLGSAGVAGKVA